MVSTGVLKLIKYIKNPNYRFIINDGFGVYSKTPDKEYTEMKFRAKLGYELNLDDPKTFNEKLQWLKLYDHRPEYTIMVDKYQVKKFVSNKIGEQFIIPTIGVWEHPKDIDWDDLPSKFVLKVTHDSGGLIICKDKHDFDISKSLDILEKSLNRNYYIQHREWPYKNVKRRIIAEQYMQDGDNKDLKDYKFYCFDGEPLFLYVSEGLSDHKTAKVSFLTMNWQFAPFGRCDYAPFTKLPEKPALFDQMVEIARTLSKGHPFIRVDLYYINQKIYFSELTFTPCAGMMPFVPESYDLELGKYIKLPNLKRQG